MLRNPSTINPAFSYSRFCGTFSFFSAFDSENCEKSQHFYEISVQNSDLKPGFSNFDFFNTWRQILKRGWTGLRQPKFPYFFDNFLLPFFRFSCSICFPKTGKSRSSRFLFFLQIPHFPVVVFAYIDISPKIPSFLALIAHFRSPLIAHFYSPLSAWFSRIILDFTAFPNQRLIFSLIFLNFPGCIEQSHVRSAKMPPKKNAKKNKDDDWWVSFCSNLSSLIFLGTMRQLRRS